MVGTADEVQEFIRKTLEGKNPNSGSLYHDGIDYQPGFVFEPVGGEGGKVTFTPTTAQMMLSSVLLNPQILTGQRIGSRINLSNQNVEYEMPDGGIVRIGFYNREHKDEQPNLSPEELPGALTELVNGEDNLFPKIPIIDRFPDTLSALTDNFPSMYNYRSVVFPGDTLWGVVLDADRSILGENIVVSDLELTSDYVREHANDMNYLLPLLMEAARQQPIDMDRLAPMDAIHLPQLGMYRIISFLDKSKYNVKMNYTLVPQFNLCLRINSVPHYLVRTKNGEERWQEISASSRAISAKDTDIFTVFYAGVKDTVEPENSFMGDFFYHALTREESVKLYRDAAQQGLDFGTLEVQLSVNYTARDVNIVFEEEPIPEEFLDIDLGSLGGHWDQDVTPFKSYSRSSLGIPRYTAGAVGIANVKRASIATSTTLPGRVLLKDVFCLVHEEYDFAAPSYN